MMGTVQSYALILIGGLAGAMALGLGLHLRRCAPYRKLQSRR